MQMIWCVSIHHGKGVNQKKHLSTNTHRFFLPSLLFGVRLPELGLEGLRLAAAVLLVFVQDVHEVGDVAGSEAQRFNLGQFGICGNIRDALAQLGERTVDALSPASLLAVRCGPPLHGARHHHHARYERSRAACSVGPVLQARPGRAHTAGGVIGGVFGTVGRWRHAVVRRRRHVRVTDEPPVEIRTFLVTAARGCGGCSCGCEGGRVAVMVHDRVVREASYQTHDNVLQKRSALLLFCI